MFHFPPFASTSYVFRRRRSGIARSGLPHSEIPGSKRMCRSPRLIAAYHVLHRRPMPRHPPHALTSLINNVSVSRPRPNGRVGLPQFLRVDVKEPPRCRGNSRRRRTSRLVGVTGVEPVTSSLSGTRSNQLSYTPYFARRLRLALRRASPRSAACHPQPKPAPRERGAKDGGGNRVRTGDPKLAKLVLCQLSYAPALRRQHSHRPINRSVLPSMTYDPLRIRNGAACASSIARVRARLYSPDPLSRAWMLLRKEVIQPQVPLRLPCYDFIPVTTHTFGTLRRLRVQTAPMM